MTIEIKLLNMDDEVLGRTLYIRHNRGSFYTPAYALSVLDFDGEIGVSPKGVVEVYLNFKPESLKMISSEENRERWLTYSMNTYTKRIPLDQLVLFIPAVEKGREQIESSNAKEYGSHIAELTSHPRADIVCTPVFNRISEEKMTPVIEGFLEAMTAYRNYVALTIPYAPRDTRRKVIETYLKLTDKNNRMLVNILCVDYDASNPITRYIFHNHILNNLRILERELNEPVILIGVNVKHGRISQKYNEWPAKDLTSYYVELDVIARNHKRKPLPEGVLEKIKIEEKEKHKLLNTNRYTYISLQQMLREPNLAIPEIKYVEKILDRKPGRLEKTVKIINSKKKIEETHVLKQLFNGKGWREYEKPLQYLKAKEIAKIDKNTIVKIEKIAKRHSRKTETLDYFLR